jgi:hypothetical protein
MFHRELGSGVRPCFEEMNKQHLSLVESRRERDAMRAARERQEAVGSAIICQPRHPIYVEPSCIGLHGIL